MTDARTEVERNAAITGRFADLEAERDDLQDRIESLVGEREELREALAVAAKHQGDFACIHVRDVARSVLSSRETTDSPTCPTCGSDDPKRSSWMQSADDVDNYCTDTFHSTDRGKDG